MDKVNSFATPATLAESQAASKIYMNIVQGLSANIDTYNTGALVTLVTKAVAMLDTPSFEPLLGSIGQLYNLAVTSTNAGVSNQSKTIFGT